MQNKSNVDGSTYVLNNIPNYFDSMADKYFLSKYVSSMNITKEEQQEIEVLQVLEQLGFPMVQTGTYFYKDVIIKTMEELQEINTQEEYDTLIKAMRNSYSQFYFDIARNTLDVGLTTFHNCISMSCEDKNKDKERNKMEQKIGLDSCEADYKLEAVLIANYVISRVDRKTASQGIKSATKKIKQ